MRSLPPARGIAVHAQVHNRRWRRVLGCGLLLIEAARIAGAQSAPPGYRTAALPAVPMESAVLLLSGQEGGVLPLRVAVVPTATEGENLRIAVWAEIETTALTATSGTTRHLDLAVYALAGAEVQASTLQSFHLDAQPTAAAKTLRFVVGLPLPPGAYSLRVLLRDRESGGVGLRKLPVEIVAPGATAIFAPLLAPDSTSPWILAGPGESSAPPISAQVASRNFSRSEGARALLLPIWQGDANAVVELRLRRAGETTGQVLRFPGEASAGANQLAFRRAELPLAQLATDEYEVATAAGAVLLRFQVGSSAIAAPRRAAAPGKPAGRGRGDTQAAASEYRRALAALAANDAAQARTILAAFEPSALASGGLRPEQLLEIEIRVADPLARAEPDAVLPALALHLDLYASRRQGSDPAGTTHAREMAATLAELYVARGGDRAVAALALLSLASKLDDTTPGLLNRTLTKATQLDAKALAAWRALAVAAERQGHLANADFYVRRWLDADPQSPEATLRLAVYAARDGQTKTALRNLRSVQRSAAASTTQRLVAAQETGRILLNAGDPAGAAEAARGGLAIEPGDEKLQLILAAALAAQGRHREAADVVAAIVASAEPNPRWTFTRPPTAELEAAARAFADQAQRALPALGRALLAIRERQ